MPFTSLTGFDEANARMQVSRSTLGLGVVAVIAQVGLAHAEPSALPPEIGYNSGELETPRSIGVGGATRAVSSSIEALYANPANMVRARIYHLGAGAQIWPQARRQTYGAAAVDSVVNRYRVAGGVSANWSSQDPDGINRDWFDFRFALAAPLSDQFYAGAALRYMSLAQGGYPDDGLRPSLASSGLEGRPIVAELTFDAGLTARLGDSFWISAVGTNLTDPGHAFLPLTLGGGLGFATDQITLEANAVSDFQTYEQAELEFMGGAEYLVGDSFPIRAGYRFDAGNDTQALSAGAGLVTPQFAFEAGIRTLIAGGNSLTLVLGFRYHVDAGAALPD
jgi:hypothetical protein